MVGNGRELEARALNLFVFKCPVERREVKLELAFAGGVALTPFFDVATQFCLRLRHPFFPHIAGRFDQNFLPIVFGLSADRIFTPRGQGCFIGGGLRATLSQRRAENSMVHRRIFFAAHDYVARSTTAGLVRLPKFDRQIMTLAVSKRLHHRSGPPTGKLSVDLFNRRRVVIT